MTMSTLFFLSLVRLYKVRIDGCFSALLVLFLLFMPIRCYCLGVRPSEMYGEV